MERQVVNRALVLTLTAATLSACGGGSGGDGGGSAPPPANSAPQFTSAASATVAENRSGVVYTATATDTNGDALTFRITGGADQGAFSLDATTGALSLAKAADFEAPADANADGTYEVALQVDDGKGGTANLALTINVQDLTQLALHVSYPTPNANLGGRATSTVVSGYLEDLEDGEVLASDVAFVDVNGERATLEMGEVVRWRARVPVAKTLNIQVADTAGRTEQVSQLLQNSFPLEFATSLALDSTGERALVTSPNAIVAINLITGERTLLSDGSTGTPPFLNSIADISLDSADERLLVAESFPGAIIAVNPATGVRTLVSNDSTGTGPSLNFLNGMVSDGERVLVTTRDSVVAVDLGNGNRDTRSGPGVGGGDPIRNPRGIISVSGQALVADAGTGAIVDVDLETGNRSLFSGDSQGTGTPLSKPRDLVLDAARSRLLVADADLGAIVEVGLETRNRETVSDSGRGTGVNLVAPQSLVLDEANTRALVADGALDAVIAVNLDSGDRKAIGDISSGSGEEFPDFNGLPGLAVDPTRGRVLIVGQRSSSVLAVDTESGDRTRFSDGLAETRFVGFRGIAVDALHDRALVSDGPSSRVFELDLNTGEVTRIVADSTTGSGTKLSAPASIAIEASGEHALVVDFDLNAVISIDLTTLERKVVSQAGVEGEGEDFESPFDIVLDEGKRRALVSDSGKNVIWSVSLDNGDRAIFSGASTGAGAPFGFVSQMALDARNGRVLVIAASPDDEDLFFKTDVVAVNLQSGERSVLSDEDAGSRLQCRSLGALTVDSLNNRAFGMCGSPSALAVIDLASGERAISSKGLVVGSDF